MPWTSPKFPTECYFMCFHCHHLSIIPCYRQYTSCLRSLRDMNRMVEELESREKEWRDTPMAARNRMLQKKWKDRIKVKRVDISERIGYNIKERKENFKMYVFVSVCVSHVRSSTYRNLCSTISVHVAQWLEHLTGHQKVTGCTHM